MASKKRSDGQWVPAPADVARVHCDLTKLFELESDPISPPGVKSQGLLESACGRPLTSIGETEKYPSLVLKLAALTQALTKNHPFHNGNKRAALATLLTALYRNGLTLKSSVGDDDIYNFIVSVTADEFPKSKHNLSPDDVVRQIAWWIKNNSEPSRSNFGTIRVSDFIDRCTQAGMQYKFANGAHIIMNPKGSQKGSFQSIRIIGATRQISGPAAASYVRKLRLNAQNSGIDSNEFYDGTSAERNAIHRYIVAMRRLAKT